MNREYAQPGHTANPILVEITRGGFLESAHRGAVAVVDARGRLLAGCGDVESPVFPRSSVKCLQAVPLVESGAASRYELNQRHLALACSSHGGESRHVEAVRRWLAGAGLRTRHLRCGAHMPYYEPAAARLIAARKPATALHNNCSGKHVGCLTTVLHMRENIGNYIDPTHPAQRRISELMSDMSGFDAAASPLGIDGCGMPVRALPLRWLALAMARFGAQASGSRVRDAACGQLYAAMTSHPWLVGGTGRFDTLAMIEGSGRFAVKMGAEGVHVAIIPGSRIGIALKIDDGTRRAADFAMARILKALRLFDPDRIGMTTVGAVPLLNSAGRAVGDIRCAPALIHAIKPRSTKTRSNT